MGIIQATILEWVACLFSSRSFQPGNWTKISCIAGGFLTNWAIREAHKHTSLWDFMLIWQGVWLCLIFAVTLVARGFQFLTCPSVYLSCWCWASLKDFHDPDNHNDVITHLEPDILECEVKWALGSISVNKASGCNGIPVELFQILKDDAVKVLHYICQQIWKTQQWPQDWKR